MIVAAIFFVLWGAFAACFGHAAAEGETYAMLIFGLFALVWFGLGACALAVSA